MIAADLEDIVMNLPPNDRLELARRLVESVVTPDELDGAIQDGIKRIEDVLTGKVAGLSEQEFRAALR